jgi:hypothetical protein
MHLTEAAIKVRRLSVHSFLTTRLFHPLSFRSLKVSNSRAHSRSTYPRSKSNERRRKPTTRLCRSGSSSRVAAATDTSTRCRSRTSETAMTSAFPSSCGFRSFQSGILAEADSSPPRSTSRFAPPTETTASLLVDSASLPLVKGSTIDYATELIGSAFRIKDNPQSKDAGCGCGVSELSVFARCRVPAFRVETRSEEILRDSAAPLTPYFYPCRLGTQGHLDLSTSFLLGGPCKPLFSTQLFDPFAWSGRGYTVHTGHIGWAYSGVQIAELA